MAQLDWGLSTLAAMTCTLGCPMKTATISLPQAPSKFPSQMIDQETPTPLYIYTSLCLILWVVLCGSDDRWKTRQTETGHMSVNMKNN